ncbi:50S ribosomal protein L15 [Candidatus Parcubacteria bacterium]|nr:50S ribosomal protein L15 [Candidatus Parcubacteria bacterium]
MQINNIKRKTPNKKRMIVARGGKRGKTAGRGTKGQKARAGHKIRPEIRDVIKRIPKMRGRGKNSNLSIQEKAVVINLDMLNKNFANGDIITPNRLVEKGLLSLRNGKVPRVKILGDGEITKKITFKDIAASAQAREKVQKAGGIA